MAIIKWRPLSEINNLFDDFKSLAINNNLAADLYEEDNKFILKINVSGIKPENVDIELEGDNLHIVAQHKQTEETEDRNYYIKEIETGKFERLIPLPSQVMGDEIKASVDNGILTIELPKQEEINKKKKININKVN